MGRGRVFEANTVVLINRGSRFQDMYPELKDPSTYFGTPFDVIDKTGTLGFRYRAALDFVVLWSRRPVDPFRVPVTKKWLLFLYLF